MTSAPFGGQQGSERTWLFGEYPKGSMSSTEAAAYNAVSGVALIPAAPFAAAKELPPPEVWNAISLFLKAGQ